MCILRLGISLLLQMESFACLQLDRLAGKVVGFYLFCTDV